MTLQELRGDPPPTLTSEECRSWSALSFCDSQEGVRRQAAIIPGIGKFVARCELPENAGITWEETLSEGHYDVRGDKEILKSSLTDDIEPI